MKILIVDDEKTAITALTRSLRKICGEAATIRAAANGKEALLVMSEQGLFDVVFLDIEMPGMSGLEVAKRIRQQAPKTNIIMVTAYPQYSLDAWSFYASGYLLKPASTAKVKEALENLRRLPSVPATERLTVQCFGNFEVYYKGERITFKRSAAKEVFAYLVSRRGAGACAVEICNTLWGDSVEADRNKAYIRVYYAEIRKALADIGMEQVLCHKRNDYAVNIDYIDCDYYRFLDGDPEAIKQYHGELMSRYAWAEELAGGLSML